MLTTMTKNILIITAIIVALMAIGASAAYITLTQGGEEVEQPMATTYGEEPTQPEEPTPTESINTSDWKTYRNEEYGFQIKYPPTIKEDEILESRNEKFFEAEPPHLFIVSFPYFWEEPPFQSQPVDYSLSSVSSPICASNFYVDIIEPRLSFSLEYVASSYDNSNYVEVSGVQGIRANQSLAGVPGGGSKEDIVYLPQGSQVYLIYYIVDKGFLVSETNAAICLEEQAKIFNSMLYTFQFID